MANDLFMYAVTTPVDDGAQFAVIPHVIDNKYYLLIGKMFRGEYGRMAMSMGAHDTLRIALKNGRKLNKTLVNMQDITEKNIFHYLRMWLDNEHDMLKNRIMQDFASI